MYFNEHTFCSFDEHTFTDAFVLKVLPHSLLSKSALLCFDLIPLGLLKTSCSIFPILPVSSCPRILNLFSPLCSSPYRKICSGHVYYILTNNENSNKNFLWVSLLWKEPIFLTHQFSVNYSCWNLVSGFKPFILAIAFCAYDFRAWIGNALRAAIGYYSSLVVTSMNHKGECGQQLAPDDWNSWKMSWQAVLMAPDSLEHMQLWTQDSTGLGHGSQWLPHSSFSGLFSSLHLLTRTRIQHRDLLESQGEKNNISFGNV